MFAFEMKERQGASVSERPMSNREQSARTLWASVAALGSTVNSRANYVLSTSASELRVPVAAMLCFARARAVAVCSR
jgi:hypothetical protein